MRFTTKLISTGALALFLVPAFRLNAAGPVVSPALTPGDKTADSSSAAAAAEPAAAHNSAPVPSASASAGADRTAAAATATGAPRMDLGIVYSYVRAVPTDTADNRMVWLNGGSASVNFHLNRHVGIVGDFGGYNDSRLRLGTSSGSPVRDSSGNAFTYLFGPRVSFGNHERFTPFAQVLLGGIHASAVTLSSGCSNIGCTPLPSENKFAMTAGGGLDLRVSQHFAIRVIQAEYLLTRFSDLSTGNHGIQNDMRLSSGIVFRFGGHKPQVQAMSEPPAAAPPVVVPVQAPVVQPLNLSCSADQTSVIAGNVVHVTATAGDTHHDPLTYTWSATAGQIVGTGATVELDTAGLTAGPSTITAHAAGAQGGSADCSVTVDARTLKPIEQKLALHSIYFPTAQPTAEDPSGGLVGSQKEILVTLASDFKAYLETNPSAKLLLEGHSDPRASVEYNQALSQRRVDGAKQFLIGQGIPEEDIQTKAFGEEQNLTDDQVRAEVARNPELNPEQRQKLLDNLTTIILASNRRVEIILTTTGQRSIRQYPFNAVDSLTLLGQDAPR